MKQVHMCIAVGVVVGGIAATERVVPLHAPISTLDPSGTAVYTKAYGRPENYFDIYSFESGTVKTVRLSPESDGGDTAQEAAKFSSGHYELANDLPDLQFTPRGNILLVRYDLYQWRNPVIRKIFSFPGGQNHLDPMGEYVVGGSEDNLSLYSLPSTQPLFQIVLKTNTEMIDSNPFEPSWLESRFLPQKQRLILATYSEFRLYGVDLKHVPKNKAELDRLIIYDPNSAEARGSEDGSLLELGSLSISPDQQYIAGGFTRESPRGQIEDPTRLYGWVRSLNDGKIKYKLLGQKMGIVKTAFSPNGKYLATLDGLSQSSNHFCAASEKYQSVLGDGTVYLRLVATGKVVKIFQHACSGLVFSKNSKKLMYSDLKYNMHIVDVP